MSTIDDLAKDFLAQKRIAVAGVSSAREEAANYIYKTLRERGYTVYAVNPHISSFAGDPCYPDLFSLPEKPDGLVIVTRPSVAEELVGQCAMAGIPRVWLHSALGTRPRLMKKVAASITSVSPEALRRCKESGISVIPGSCPMQFLGADFGHTCMRGILRATGALEVASSAP